MTTEAEKARIALIVYRDRGLATLDLLGKTSGNSGGSVSEDELDELMRKRAAAFHNFAALDHRALSIGQDVAALPGVSELWSDVSRINKEISERLAVKSAKVERQLAVGQRHNKVAMHYHSGEPRPIRFVKGT